MYINIYLRVFVYLYITISFYSIVWIFKKELTYIYELYSLQNIIVYLDVLKQRL